MVRLVHTSRERFVCEWTCVSAGGLSVWRLCYNDHNRTGFSPVWVLRWTWRKMGKINIFSSFSHKNIYLDVGLVEEPSVTYVTMVHHFLPLVPLSSTTPTPSRANSSGPEQTLKQKENINILWSIYDLCEVFPSL